MRHSLLKLTGLLMALTLALTGCNLIGVDQMKQLDVDFANLDKDYATVVAEYDGGQLTKGDVLGSYASMYSYYTQMYSMFGMNITSDVVENIKQQTLENAVRDVAIAREFDNRGMSLTQEKLDEIKSTADENYKQAYDTFYASAEGKGEVKEKQTRYNMYLNGYKENTFYDLQLAQAKADLLEESIKAEVTDLTDEQLQTAYDEKVAADKEAYTDKPGDFETAMSNADEVVAWIPDGYRTVKHILVKPEDAVLTAVTDARTALDDARSDLEDLEDELEDADPAEKTEEKPAEDAEATEAPAEPERTPEQIKAEIETARKAVEDAEKAVSDAEAACLESVKAKTDEIYAKIAEGADFNDLIAEYGEDPGMKNEPTATRGYYVCADQGNWDANFNAGAMALAKVGDVSETPVISTSGVHIIRYESDVTGGEVGLDAIREKLHDTTLETARETHFNETMDSLTAALKPVYHPEAFTLG